MRRKSKKKNQILELEKFNIGEGETAHQCTHGLFQPCAHFRMLSLNLIWYCSDCGVRDDEDKATVFDGGMKVCSAWKPKTEGLPYIPTLLLRYFLLEAEEKKKFREYLAVYTNPRANKF